MCACAHAPQGGIQEAVDARYEGQGRISTTNTILEVAETPLYQTIRQFGLLAHHVLEQVHGSACSVQHQPTLLEGLGVVGTSPNQPTALLARLDCTPHRVAEVRS